MFPKQQTKIPSILQRMDEKANSTTKQIPLFGNLIKREAGGIGGGEAGSDDIIEMAPRVNSELVQNFGFHATSRRG